MPINTVPTPHPDDQMDQGEALTYVLMLFRGLLGDLPPGHEEDEFVDLVLKQFEGEQSLLLDTIVFVTHQILRLLDDTGGPLSGLGAIRTVQHLMFEGRAA